MVSFGPWLTGGSVDRLTECFGGREFRYAYPEHRLVAVG